MLDAAPRVLGRADGPRSGLTLLVDKYSQRTVAMLSTWLNNIVEVGGRWMGGCSGGLLAAGAVFSSGQQSDELVWQAARQLGGMLTPAAFNHVR